MKIIPSYTVGLLFLVLLTFVIGQLSTYEDYRSAAFLIMSTVKARRREVGIWK